MTLPFALANVQKVTFFKRDEITTDLICCEVVVGVGDDIMTWSGNEEETSWQAWIQELSALPNFDSAWFSQVSQPAFTTNVTVAYERPVS